MSEMETDHVRGSDEIISADRLLREFGQLLIDNEDVLSELLKLGLKYKISESDLYNKFEEYMMKRAVYSKDIQPEQAPITLELIQNLDKELAASKASHHSIYNEKVTRAKLGISKYKEGVGFTFSNSALPVYIKTLIQGTSPDTNSYEEFNVTKEDSENVIVSFNTHLPIVYYKMNEFKLVHLNNKYFEDFKNMRYMDIDMDKVSEYISSRIEYMDLLFSQRRSLPNLNAGEIYMVGKLSYDTTTHEHPPNLYSFSFDVPNRITGPQTMNLDLSSLASCGQRHSLFPGQMVALTGNSLGSVESNEVLVTRIFYPPIISETDQSDRSLLNMQDLKSPNTTFIVASGPFTTADDLNYNLLETLTRKIEAATPNLVILLGPFVDEEHPLISSCSVTEDPNTLFCRHISPKLSRIISAGSKLVLIPAINDMISEWVILPQPPIATSHSPGISKQVRTSLSIPSEVLLYPNPSTFYLNDTLISVTSSDSIGHISKAELALDPQPTNESNTDSEQQVLPSSKYGKYFFHLLSQQSIYPLLYPPSATNPSDTCINLNELNRLELLTFTDILIVPSSIIPPMVEKIYNCLCINPGVVYGSNNNPGSFALISINHNPPRVNTINQRTFSRTRVDIKRI